MFLLLFAFWVLLNGQWTTEIAVVGAVLSGLITLFLWKFMGYSLRREGKLLRRLGRIVRYLGWLVGEILRSAWATMRLIWSPSLQTEPRLTCLRSRLRTVAGRVALADSITLTPGTVTVSIQEDRLLVHSLDTDFAEGLTDSEMENRLLTVEGGKPRA